jgi:RNA recognition motif-containing protein
LVRTPRQGKKKVAQKIKYCYLEFVSEAECEKAKEELSKSGDRFFVDFVGEKSRNLRHTSKEGGKPRPINPMRLFVNGLPKSITAAKLKLLFPKSVNTQVKTKGSVVGFVQFSNAGDAKSGSSIM